MHLITAIILGLIEGATEFLPISSTGHLIIAGHALGFTGDTANTFEVFIQLGAILAVVAMYIKEFWSLLPVRKGKGFEGWNGLRLLIITTIPAAIMGLIFHDFIKEHLFSPLTVALGLLVGGIAILVIESKDLQAKLTSMDAIQPSQAWKVGLFQVLSLVPGVSRSASTILGGMLVGLDRETAVKYSFFAAVPVMVAATGFDLLKSLSSIQSTDYGMFAVGFVSAFISGLIAINLLLKLVKRSNFKPFGWYRILLAIVVLLVLGLK